MPATPPYFPPETYNGHPARYATDSDGNITGLIKPNSNTEIAPFLVSWVGTQAEYDAIATKDDNTQYNIVAA